MNMNKKSIKQVTKENSMRKDYYIFPSDKTMFPCFYTTIAYKILYATNFLIKNVFSYLYR